LRLNIHRHFARLPGARDIRDTSTFLPRDSVVDYLTDYARGLGGDIHLDTRVRSVQRDGDVWHVETNKGIYACTHLIVATGRERIPDMPVWPGMERFGGEVIHAANFAAPSTYDGKNVLVIGADNSGSDVLNHLSRSNPAKVWVSVRHGPAVLPTRLFGFPMHRLASLFARFPKWSIDPAFAVMQRLFIGDLRRYGLRRHALGGGSRMLEEGVTFALDDGFVAALKAGRFEAVNETVGFLPHSVELADGRAIDADVVICATGYRSGLEDLFGDLGALDARGYPLHPLGQEDAKNPGLWFTGYDVVFQGFFHAAGIGAGRIASAIAAQTSLRAEHRSATRVSKPTPPKTRTLEGTMQRL
jgi:cation diffusion facilitator CzcD-associated flavoprotein CzcO